VAEPVATLGAASLGAASLAAALSAGALEVPAEVHAAMIAGTLTRPAVPAIPLRTVRLETAFIGIGSTMACSSSIGYPTRCATKPDRTNQIVGMRLPDVKRIQWIVDVIC
jgi:hypothetical protein